MKAIDLEPLKLAFGPGTLVADLCDEIEGLRASNIDLAVALATARQERDAALEHLSPTLGLNPS